MKKGSVIKLKDTRLTISKVCSNVEKDYITIRLEDGDSSIRIIEAKVSLENFAKALTGMSYIQCESEVYLTDEIGKIHEHKEIPVELPYDASKEKFEEAVKEFCIDGWITDYRHFKSSQKKSPTNKPGHYYVGFHRWIKKETKNVK